MATRVASSSNTGFFQPLPTIRPAYTSLALSSNHETSDDHVFARLLCLYLPCDDAQEIHASIHALSRLVLQPSILRLTVDCESIPPSFTPLRTFGDINKIDPLRTSEGWRALKDINTSQGLIAHGYRQTHETAEPAWNRRIHQFALHHVWVPAAALVTCPSSMTDGAASLLSRHISEPDNEQPGRRAVLNEVYRRLISQDPGYAWTSGQWMTERSGGSDVRNTESVARKLSAEEMELDRRQGRDTDAHNMPLGPWAIDGFKWFSSATDSEMAVLLAQTARGLSAFYVPMRRRCGVGMPEDHELNGIRIQRLKSKLGTQGLPTAELELQGARGWLLGEEGKGVREIATVLNVTRVYTATEAAGYWARGLAVSRAYTKTRRVRDGLLSDNALHLRWMADETVRYWAAKHLSFLGVALLGTTEQGRTAHLTKADGLIPRDADDVRVLLRLLTPVMKAQVSVKAVEGIRACMESLGGVGYCENNEDGGIMNIARLFRDSAVAPIWEGTVNIMAEDCVRVLTDSRLGGGSVIENVFGKWVESVLQASRVGEKFRKELALVRETQDTLVGLIRGADVQQLRYEGRTILRRIDTIASACLLMYDACTDGDEVAVEVARRWIWSISPASPQYREQQDWRTQAALDKKIFLGSGSLDSSTTQAKL
ncbi:acyl-CoA dehydrogenase/oxidase C-terminal [Xylariaceae sp. FL0016]|nr:acyl-CoA dehydrogenase/oxidase C-terminal [Xylariaceae sp. FL0016]